MELLGGFIVLGILWGVPALLFWIFGGWPCLVIFVCMEVVRWAVDRMSKKEE